MDEIVRLLKEKPFWTSKELANLLRIGDRTIMEMCKKGTITAYKVGGEWRIFADDAIAYLRKVRNIPEPE